MSKLMELIGRLGQQSTQPIGFGALTGRVEAAPTMALIGSASSGEVGSELPDGVDAIAVRGGDVQSIVDSVDASNAEGLVWGVNGGQLSNDDLENLIDAGCDYILIESSAPAGVVGHPDLGTIVVTDEPADRLTGAALRSLRVDGSLNTSAIESGGLNFAALVNVLKVGASIGGAILVEVSEKISTADLTALRDAGVDGLVVSLGDTELVGHVAKEIRELPPRRRSEARGLSPTAPVSES